MRYITANARRMMLHRINLRAEMPEKSKSRHTVVDGHEVRQERVVTTGSGRGCRANRVSRATERRGRERRTDNLQEAAARRGGAHGRSLPDI